MKYLHFFFLWWFIGYNIYAQLTFKDVAPILYQRCTYCHRPDGGGPFPLMTYSNVYANRSIIEYMVQNDLMPPRPPDTTFSRFVNERILTFQEKQLLLDWLAQGAPAGDITLASPPPPPAPSYKIPNQPI